MDDSIALGMNVTHVNTAKGSSRRFILLVVNRSRLLWERVQVYVIRKPEVNMNRGILKLCSRR